LTFAPDAVVSEIDRFGPTLAFSRFGFGGVTTVPDVNEPRIVVGCALQTYW
jgi:hypothetical protein